VARGFAYQFRCVSLVRHAGCRLGRVGMALWDSCAPGRGCPGGDQLAFPRLTPGATVLGPLCGLVDLRVWGCGA
jgi:hypothetical protein